MKGVSRVDAVCKADRTRESPDDVTGKVVEVRLR